MRPRPAAAGFTLLELAVVVAIVALLASFGAERMLRYAEQAEKGAMDQAVGAMKSALSLRFGAFYVRGQQAAIDALASENPMDWLAEKPPGYHGVLRAPDRDTLERPGWYYDASSRELVYLPARTRYLAGRAGAERQIRYRVAVEFGPDEVGAPARLNRLGIDATPAHDWFQTLQ